MKHGYLTIPSALNMLISLRKLNGVLKGVWVISMQIPTTSSKEWAQESLRPPSRHGTLRNKSLAKFTVTFVTSESSSTVTGEQLSN